MGSSRGSRFAAVSDSFALLRVAQVRKLGKLPTCEVTCLVDECIPPRWLGLSGGTADWDYNLDYWANSSKICIDDTWKKWACSEDVPIDDMCTQGACGRRVQAEGRWRRERCTDKSEIEGDCEPLAPYVHINSFCAGDSDEACAQRYDKETSDDDKVCDKKCGPLIEPGYPFFTEVATQKKGEGGKKGKGGK